MKQTQGLAEEQVIVVLPFICNLKIFGFELFDLITNQQVHVSSYFVTKADISRGKANALI